MPREPRHPAKRAPYHNYTRASYNWLPLFRACDDGCSRRKLARDSKIPHMTLVSRYNDWIKAGRPSSDTHTPHDGLGDSRGHVSRILTDIEEQILLQQLQQRRNTRPTHDSHIRKYALQLYQARQAQHMADENQNRATRSNTSSQTFTASDGWIDAFKNRTGLTTTTRPILHPSQPRDKTVSTQQFITHLRHFTNTIPISHIYNMDETFIAYAPGYFKVLSRRGDRTKLCTGMWDMMIVCCASMECCHDVLLICICMLPMCA